MHLLWRDVDFETGHLHVTRRSGITNGAKRLPVHVVQQLAGHSDITTTQRFYLSVQEDDLAEAKQVQSQVVRGVPDAALTDPKVTHSSQMRAFPGRKIFDSKL